MKDLTIVIPSFNRPKELMRQVPFWDNTDATVIILDGSKIPLQKNQNLPNNITYYHLPISLSERLAFSRPLIKTKFVVMLADDEIYLPSGLEASIEFLKKNPDYSACKGLCIGFRKNYFNSSIEAVFAYQNLRNYSLAYDNPCKRVVEHLSDYRCASIYAVHRKEVYDKFTKMLSFGSKYSADASLEIQVSIITAWLGKINVLDQFMWLRNRENPGNHLNSKCVEPWTWIKDNKYKDEISTFILDFEKTFPREPNINICVKKALELYSSKISTKKQMSLVRFIKKFFSIIWLSLPESVKCIIRPLIGTNKNIIDLAISINKTGVKIDQEELKLVNKFLETN